MMSEPDINEIEVNFYAMKNNNPFIRGVIPRGKIKTNWKTKYRATYITPACAQSSRASE